MQKIKLFVKIIYLLNKVLVEPVTESANPKLILLDSFSTELNYTSNPLSIVLLFHSVLGHTVQRFTKKNET